MSFTQPLNEQASSVLGADQTVTSATYVDVLTLAINVLKSQDVLVWALVGTITANALSSNILFLQLWDDTGAVEIASFRIELNTSAAYADVTGRRIAYPVTVTGGTVKSVKLRAKVGAAGDSFTLASTNTCKLGYVATED